MASAAGWRSKKSPALPSRFQFDIPLLRAVGNPEQAKQVHPGATAVSHDKTPHARLLSKPPAPTNRGKQSNDLWLLALQIQQQKLEIKKLELEAHIKASNTKSPLVKHETVLSLSTVRQSPNAGKSLGQLIDYNVRRVAAFTCPFWLNKKEIQGSLSCRIRVWQFRYYAGCQWRATGGHVNPFNGIDAFGSQVYMAFCSVISCCRCRLNRGRFSFLGRWFHGARVVSLFQRLGLEFSLSKDWAPSTHMLFLGLAYGTLKMAIEVPQDKLDSITLVKLF